MGEGEEKSLAQELIERGMKKEMANECLSLLVKIGSRRRRAAYIEEIIGDMATLFNFKTNDYIGYIRFYGTLMSCLDLMMMRGFLAVDQNTGEYAVTEAGLKRVEKFLPRVR